MALAFFPKKEEGIHGAGIPPTKKEESSHGAGTVP